MRRRRSVSLLLVLVADVVSAQAPTPQQPTFDVVSIRLNTSGVLDSRFDPRPDGGLTVVNLPMRTVIFRAFPENALAPIVGLPDWAVSERYDVTATASLPNPTAAEQTAMLRALLADRFKLVAHVEKREREVYELVRANEKGTLGRGLRYAGEAVDCQARLAAEQAASAAAAASGQVPPRLDLNATPPPCVTYFRGNGTEMAGHLAMSQLAIMLGGAAGRTVVDKTGLAGMYYVSMVYDRMASIRGPAPADSPDAAPSVFTAVQQDLGLRLQSSRAEFDTLIIDRLERPTEN